MLSIWRSLKFWCIEKSYLNKVHCMPMDSTLYHRIHSLIDPKTGKIVEKGTNVDY